MQVIPSILEKDIASFVRQLQRLSPHFKTFQIDIEDGEYVPTKTIGIETLIDYFSANQSTASKNISFDFDLMTKNLDMQLTQVKKLGQYFFIKNIFVHPSSPQEFQDLQKNFPDFILGLSLNPEDDVKTVKNNYDLKNMPIIQIMTIHPGPQGQQFIPETLNKVEQLRMLDYRYKIYLDGGINDETIPKILEQKYRPDFLCIGSYLTKAENLVDRINNLATMIQTS